MLATVILLLAQSATAQPAASTRAAIQRALPALERSAKTFVAERSCVSCHHNILPILTLRLAASRGFNIDATILATIERKTFRELTNGKAFDDAVQLPDVGDPAVNGSWLLTAASQAGVAPNVTSGVIARRIATWQQDGHWTTSDFRPPHSSSRFTATAIAVRAIRAYLPGELRAVRDEALGNARRWLTATRPASTEDATFRVLGLVWADAPAADVRAAANDLHHLQRVGGGWAQLPTYLPDAYSTGEALYALREAGAAGDLAWRRGILFLRSTQRSDGTWHVRTRMLSPADVSPPYFTTGFPYEQDEYISYAASCWATMALLGELPVVANARTLAAPVAEPAPDGPRGALRAVLFGAASDIPKDIDANWTTANGTSLLMAAAPDESKVAELLRRGASVKFRSAAGYDALTVAATYRGSMAAMRVLLDAGAGADPPDDVKVRHTPIMFASVAGDADNVALLLSRGAHPNPRPNAAGDSPISQAITYGHTAVVHALIQAGAKTDLVERTGVNLLHWAAITNRADVIPELTKAGVDVNAIDEHGFTPLMYAATIDFGDTATLRALLASGADRRIKNESGRTPLEQAKRLGYAHLAKALQ
jgi:ankyrin repeat protein